MNAYLDNSATTKPCTECTDAVVKMMTENFANASSLHKAGVNAMKELILSRNIIADALSCDMSEIFFTSGGTEANNLAVFGSVEANKRKGNKIVTTAIEHESILAPCAELEKAGYEIVRLVPNEKGNITPEQIFNAVDDKTILVSTMYVNNEVGSILPVETVKDAIKAKNSPALFHTDCVQAFGKLPVKPSKIKADLLTITAHKIHGPKGCGALYIKKGVRIIPRTYGGEQESRIRPGTESTPLIAGFAGAVKALPDLKKQKSKIAELNAYAKEQLKKIGMVFNSSDEATDYIINAALEGIRSQTLIQFLSEKGVYVSSGSACSKGKKSHVLTAMGLQNDIIDSSIRISFSRYNTKEDIDELANALNEAKLKLARR